MADAEREQEAVERRRTLVVDRRDQIARRQFRPALAGQQRLAWFRRKMSAGDWSSLSRKKLSIWTSPSPSMSSAWRDTKWRSRSTRCAGQISPPVQR
jgi:hypothetical protein